MLRGHKSPGTLVAEIKMLRTSHDGAFLIVEGKDGVRFWRPRRHAGCDLIDGEGKPNVIGAVRRLDATRFGGALGVVDSDFELLTGGRVESGNLLYTDAHDLECLLCRSSALDKVLAEHGDVSKIRRFESAGNDVRTALTGTGTGIRSPAVRGTARATGGRTASERYSGSWTRVPGR